MGFKNGRTLLHYYGYSLGKSLSEMSECLPIRVFVFIAYETFLWATEKNMSGVIFEDFSLESSQYSWNLSQLQKLLEIVDKNMILGAREIVLLVKHFAHD